jgi:protease-4
MRKNPLALVLGLSALFFVVFVAISIATVSWLGTGRGAGPRRLFGKTSNIGVLEVKGVITDSKKLMEQLDAFSEDPLIKAIIVRINSPGGAVGPSQELYEAVRKAAKKKPTFASMGSVAASGGYYIAAGAKRIFANPGTITGSIGVIMQFADMSKLFQWAKMNPYNIKTGQYKDIGSPNREMTPEEKALLQGMLNNVLGQFRRAVAEGRGLTMDKVVALSDGRIFSGEQAKTEGLVDELGGMTEAVDAVAKEAGITGKPKLVYGKKRKKAWEKLFEDLEDDDADSEESTLDHIISTVRALASFGGAGLPSPRLPSGPLFILPHFSTE